MVLEKKVAVVNLSMLIDEGRRRVGRFARGRVGQRQQWVPVHDIVVVDICGNNFVVLSILGGNHGGV